MRRDATVVAGQRMARLLLMIGMAIAAYLVLSIFDHAARADDDAIGHIANGDTVASVKRLSADPREVASAPKTAKREAPAPKAKAATAAKREAPAPKAKSATAAKRVAAASRGRKGMLGLAASRATSPRLES